MATSVQTGFFSLPGEVRNRIYHYILHDLRESVRGDRTTEDFSENTPQRFPGEEEHKAIPLGAIGHIEQPAFSQTCQTVRRELLTILYGSHIFVGNVLAVQKFLKHLGEQSRQMLRRVCITWPVPTEKRDHALACLRHVQQSCSRRERLKDGVLRFEITPRDDPESTVWVCEQDLKGVEASESMLKTLARRSP